MTTEALRELWEVDELGEKGVEAMLELERIAHRFANDPDPRTAIKAYFRIERAAKATAAAATKALKAARLALEKQADRTLRSDLQYRLPEPPEHPAVTEATKIAEHVRQPDELSDEEKAQLRGFLREHEGNASADPDAATEDQMARFEAWLVEQAERQAGNEATATATDEAPKQEAGDGAPAGEDIPFADVPVGEPSPAAEVRPGEWRWFRKALGDGVVHLATPENTAGGATVCGQKLPRGTYDRNIMWEHGPWWDGIAEEAIGDVCSTCRRTWERRAQ